MSLLRETLARSPIHARAVPYGLLLLLTFVQDEGFKGDGRYWLYLVKMLIGAWCIFEMRSLVPEMRWAVSWEAIVVGIAVFVIWVGLDPYYFKLNFLVSKGEPWNPLHQFGDTSVTGWFFVAVRTVGSALVVPPIEESCYRSFLYRYFVKLDFTQMPLNRMHWLSFVVTSMLFGFVHYEWLAGVLCGMAFQWLVVRKNRLGDAMTAHAITNFLLGIYIPWRGDWHFW
jgi:CAAX protease family protein